MVAAGLPARQEWTRGGGRDAGRPLYSEGDLAILRRVKRIRPLVFLSFALALVFAPLAWAAAKPTTASDRSPGAPVAHALSTVTGMAISPLLGTSAFGAFQWIKADNAQARAALPWYAQPKFWLPALLIVGVCALKDGFGAAVPPMLKKPLDVLEVVENKFSGLIAAGAVVPFAMDTFSKLLLQQSSATDLGTAGHGFAMITPFAASWAPLLDVLTIPFGIAMFLVVWMASHAINVLILLSPWGAIDAALKSGRTALLGLLTLTATINPVLGAVLSVVVIIIAYFVAGWAFRLTVFGAVVSWDFFTGRRGRFVVADDGNLMFAGAGFAGVPIRTYGRLIRRTDGGLEFVYRPWLVMQPRTATVPAPASALAVGSGLFFSVIVPETGGNVFILPPRYRGHETELAQRYALGRGVIAVGLRKAWASFRELIGGRATAAPASV